MVCCYSKKYKTFSILILFFLDAINSLLAHVRKLELSMTPEEYATMKEIKSMFNIMRDCLKILQSETESCSNMVIPFHHDIIVKLVFFPSCSI